MKRDPENLLSDDEEGRHLTVGAVGVESMTVALESGKTGSFSLDRFARHCLMNGLDELGFLIEQQPLIGAWEAACER